VYSDHQFFAMPGQKKRLTVAALSDMGHIGSLVMCTLPRGARGHQAYGQNRMDVLEAGLKRIRISFFRSTFLGLLQEKCVLDWVVQYKHGESGEEAGTGRVGPANYAGHSLRAGHAT
jgi:hypothetical protein